MSQRYLETLYPGYGQSFEMEQVVHEVRTEHQHLVIFDNPRMGRVMALDGVIQTTQADEFIYHEMLAHVPLLAHPNPRRVLIVGGGDGGILREVARHPGVEEICMVEIDSAVIELSQRFLPEHSAGAFADPRLRIIIGDGLDYVRECTDSFDVIISDSTDPVGPAEVLFSVDFYQACARCLTPQGILVTQNGTPFMQGDELRNTARRLRQLYRDGFFYNAAVPTYIGGIMVFGWATQDIDLRQCEVATLQARFCERGLKTRYYTPELHRAAFALPAYVLEAIAEATGNPYS